MLYVRLTINVKVGIPAKESFKVGWYPHTIISRVTLMWNALQLIGYLTLFTQNTYTVAPRIETYGHASGQ